MKKKAPEISEQDVNKGIDRWNAGVEALGELREAVGFFKISTGEQDVSRAVVNQFLIQLDAGINKLTDIFKQ